MITDNPSALTPLLKAIIHAHMHTFRSEVPRWWRRACAPASAM